MQFFYQQTVFAGVPLQLPYGGLYFVLASAGAARKVSIQLTNNGQTSKVMPDMTPGFSLPTQFDGITFTSATDTIVSFFASPTPVLLGVQDNGAVRVPDGVVVTNSAGQRIPVDVGGAVLSIGSLVIANTPAQAVPVTLHGSDDTTPIPIQKAALATIYHQAAVSVGVAVTALVSDATLKRVCFRNAHATAIVALGGAGVTLANGTIQLQPGDTWIEDDAAGAAWYAISDTAAANIQVQGLKS
jgi:hypothetical protein